MGALHAGHLNLIENCRRAADLTVCSIFVNPAQFNDPKDFEKYPVSIEKDIEMLTNAGTSILFLPSVEEIYPDGPGQPGNTMTSATLETYWKGAIGLDIFRVFAR